MALCDGEDRPMQGCRCKHCEEFFQYGTGVWAYRFGDGGTFNSTSFKDKPQRDNPSIMNTYFNSGKVDGNAHGHVQHRRNSDGTTDYFFARDVEGTEYDV